MRRLELVYLPYYVLRVGVSQGGDEHEVVVCIDGICCGFSFFDAKQVAFRDRARGTVFDFVVSVEEAKQACLDNLRWHLVRQGLRLKVSASITEIRKEEKIFYPYWVAYFKGASGYDFRAADAVTGEVQGVRMRNVFLTAFSQGAGGNRAVSSESSSPLRTQSTRR